MVSVIIPTYNREKTILKSVQSVLEQTYDDFEILVIDDASTDATEELIGKMQDTRVRYIQLKENGGVSHARNIGVQYARGEWIAFQDSDDYWRKDKLEKQMTYADTHPWYELIYGMYLAHLADGSEVLSLQEPWPEVLEGHLFHTLLVKNVIGAPTILVKRDAFVESGGFDITYKSLEDWEYVLRFAAKHQIGFVPEILMDVYMLQGGISSHVGNYFESRCRLLGNYKEELLQADLFDTVAMDILNRAQKVGILEQVKKLIGMYL